jgi:hypothetical protein
MKIPKPGTTETIIHKGVERTIVVHSVDPEVGTMWRVWVDSTEDVFANGDEVLWVDASDKGKKLPTFVRDLFRGEDLIRFALVAGADW